MRSLDRKGAASFLRDRVLRLGVPFVIAALIAPLAYYPTYLLTGTSTGLAGLWHQWRSLGDWPAGPAWFIWVLLAFDCIAAALLLLIPNWGAALGRGLAGVSRRPILFFASVVAVSALACVPLALVYGPVYWFSFGPFFFQSSQPLHYLVYFLVGAGVAACGFNGGPSRSIPGESMGSRLFSQFTMNREWKRFGRENSLAALRRTLPEVS
jgi:hypothetical protein